jgi:hypothetical protein
MSRLISLGPDEDWVPDLPAGSRPVGGLTDQLIQSRTEIRHSDSSNPADENCFHLWRSVVLFRTTVIECSKCGKLKKKYGEQSDGES